MAVVSKKRLPPINFSFTASYNREHEWRQCCAAAMGFEWVDRFEDDVLVEARTSNPNVVIQQVINLMDEEEREENEYSLYLDSWTETAHRMRDDLKEMARWIQSKKQGYIGLGMGDDEASLIQSTITSFAATTASELETLRKLIPSGDSGHRQGIVQILLNELQEHITQPFSVLQRQRTRSAVQLWQNPWQCKLAPTPGSSSSPEEEINEVCTSDKRFMARTTLMIPEEDFLDKYRRDPLQEVVHRPAFMNVLQERALRERDQELDRPSEMVIGPSNQMKEAFKKGIPYQKDVVHQDALEQEAILMQETIIQSDVDSVQKMEQRMVEITTLIGQFSNLVTEQQEEILDIAQHAKETKENMSKGQENLIDATERTKRSKHYMAWTIFGLSMTLLFFHTLRN